MQLYAEYSTTLHYMVHNNGKGIICYNFKSSLLWMKVAWLDEVKNSPNPTRKSTDQMVFRIQLLARNAFGTPCRVVFSATLDRTALGPLLLTGDPAIAVGAMESVVDGLWNNIYSCDVLYNEMGRDCVNTAWCPMTIADGTFTSCVGYQL